MLTDGYHDVPQGKIAAVVTHLEMLTPAPIKAVPCPHGVELQALKAPRAAEYRQLFRRIGEDWLWFSRTVFEDAALEAILHDPDVALFTLMFEGEAHAILELDFRIVGECELAFFGLTKALMGTGAGRYLMNHALQHAWARPIKRFHVHTCTVDSSQALAFYQRSGFQAYKRQVEIADDPRISKGWSPDLAPHMPVI